MGRQVGCAGFDIKVLAAIVDGDRIMTKRGQTMALEESHAPDLSRLAGRQPVARVLAAAGVGPVSRCAGMVRGGRLAVDGQVVHDPQARVDPFRAQVTLDGRPLPLDNACRYLLLHKPYGVVCAFSDPEGRPTLADYVDVAGVYAAGRLDLDSEGLVLLTDDGWLIHHLSHPRYQHPRTYLVQVEGAGPKALAALRRGVTFKGQRTAPAEVELLAGEPGLPPRPVPVRTREQVPTAWLRLVLTEGRKRQVRHMTAAVGHPTLRLVRVEIGPLRLGRLKPGQWRELTPDEMETLRALLSRRRAGPGPSTERSRAAPRPTRRTGR
jgi:23S rRNA pseudouridine2457 synthase